MLIQNGCRKKAAIFMNTQFNLLHIAMPLQLSLRASLIIEFIIYPLVKYKPTLLSNLHQVSKADKAIQSYHHGYERPFFECFAD